MNCSVTCACRKDEKEMKYNNLTTGKIEEALAVAASL
jgi:hypothetical protein